MSKYPALTAESTQSPRTRRHRQLVRSRFNHAEAGQHQLFLVVPHDIIDVGPAASMEYNVMASGVLFHNGSRYHVCRRIDLGAAALFMYNVMATSSDLFHNGITHHDPPHIDLGSAATRYNGCHVGLR